MSVYDYYVPDLKLELLRLSPYLLAMAIFVVYVNLLLVLLVVFFYGLFEGTALKGFIGAIAGSKRKDELFIQ